MKTKFRLWDKRFSEFVEDFFVSEDGKIYKKSTDTGYGIAISKETSDKVILMQSTGLKDKNGKDIFEGDILACKTDDEVINLNIFWDEEHALFMFESKKYNEQEPLAELVENNTYPFEIIGNIYENPELLEDKE